MVILGQFQSAQVCSEEHESDSGFSSEISPMVGLDVRIPRDKAAAPRSKTSTDMGRGSFTQSETLTAEGSFSVVTVSSGSADSLPKRRCSDISRARPRVSKGPFFFDEDDRHLNNTPVIAMDTEWGGEESSGFSSTTGSEEADFHANFCRFRGRRKSSADSFDVESRCKFSGRSTDDIRSVCKGLTERQSQNDTRTTASPRTSAFRKRASHLEVAQIRKSSILKSSKVSVPDSRQDSICGSGCTRNREVRVVYADGEWPGLDDSTSESSDSTRNDRRTRFRGPAFRRSSRTSINSTAEDTDCRGLPAVSSLGNNCTGAKVGKDVTDAPLRKPFVSSYTFWLHGVDVFVRIAVLCQCADHGLSLALRGLVLLQLAGFVASSNVISHGADLLQWASDSLLVLFMFCQKLKAPTMRIPRLSRGPVNAFAVSLITGVPFLLLSTYVTLTSTRSEWVLITANSVVLGMVSLGIVRLDLAISSYVLKWHQMNSLGGLTLQCLYPLAHYTFRVAEVLLRVVTVTCLFVFLRTEVALLIVAADFFAGFAALQWHSPDKEVFRVHMVVAFSLLVADVTYFVDQPNFVLPARSISRNVLQLRLLAPLLFFLCIRGGVSKFVTMNHGKLEMFLLVSVSYYVSLYFLLRRYFGQDLHTAAKNGDVELTERLLVHDPASESVKLDVNAVTKDSLGMTASMLAAERGHQEVLRTLVQAHAQLNLQNSNGNTCLHLAAHRGEVETCKLLVESGADPLIRNLDGDAPEDLARQRSVTWTWLPEDKDQGKLLNTLSTTTGPESSRSRRRSSFVGYDTIDTHVCSGMQLQGLFPDACDDVVESPRCHLHSVSALLVSRTAGMWARQVLARSRSKDEIQLEKLKRVKELGRGGFGHVIEVELECSGGPSHSKHPTRFALKLQQKARSTRQAYSEVRALRRANHPFIVRLECAFQTPSFFALLLELCPTDLNRILCETSQGRCTGLIPSRTARYMGQVLLALAHLHQQEGIVYRDVKPDNILISDRDEAKLTDFGLAKIVPSGGRRMSFCGTAGFFPPELSLDGDGCGSEISLSDGEHREMRWQRDPFKMDAYSFGVTLQVTLLGEDAARRRHVRRKGAIMLPLLLNESENTEVLESLRNAGRLSDAAFDLLVNKLLLFDQGQRSRLTDRSVLFHPFFLQALGCEDIEEHLIPV
eukprot:CAMPEP_0194504286 /NCGR_PEP_ID=MMETSP0253-20130528/28860_1 /TAXON_ID=2966 /ORGANISM="Noctiluca scintillans" /LENGTH=1173 /DNA_ID=CAMNT_0039346659 /DNA_START=71 /DNA_END=3592 /DNA_ORIENTATION=-